MSDALNELRSVVTTLDEAERCRAFKRWKARWTERLESRVDFDRWALREPECGARLRERSERNAARALANEVEKIAATTMEKGDTYSRATLEFLRARPRE